MPRQCEIQPPRSSARERIESLVPLVRWISSYSKAGVVADFITGVTIGLVIIPQSIAYVALVGLSAKIGLLSSAIGGMVYAVCGSVKEISIAPTAMMSLLTNLYRDDLPQESTGLLTFGCSVVGFVFSVSKLGWAVEFISLPVCSAFGSGVAFTIVAAELKNLFGLQYKSNAFVDSLVKFYQNASKFEPSDLCLAVLSMVLILVIGKVKDIPLKKSWKYRDTIKNSLWFAAMSRNAITLLLACFLTNFFITCYGEVPYALSAPVPPGLPEFVSPLVDTKIANTTVTIDQKIGALYSGMIVIPIVALLVHVSIAKSFDNGNKVSVSQELFSNALCNGLCSFFNSSPIAGAFSRSGVSNDCNVKTPISNIYAAAMAFLALTYLTPYVRLIPKASLSAVIVVAIVEVINYRLVILLWKYSKKDLIVMFVTFFASLFYGIEKSLIIGMLCNSLFLVYLWARPSVIIERCECEYGHFAMVTPELSLFFPAVSYVEEKLDKTLKTDGFRSLPIAVNCVFLRGYDYTAVKGLMRILKSYQRQQRKIIIFNADENLRKMCGDMDESLSGFFLHTEDYKRPLFGDELELTEIVQTNPIVKPNLIEVKGTGYKAATRNHQTQESSLLCAVE